jgi:hypothetical protein
MSPGNQQELFFELSKNLCGFDDLSHGLSNVYYSIFASNQTTQADLQLLLTGYEKIVNDNPKDIINAIQTKILSEENLRNLALSIIKLWYLGVIPIVAGGPTDTTLELQGYNFYYEALVWRAAKAHPPGLSKAFYGHWSYKPES